MALGSTEPNDFNPYAMWLRPLELTLASLGAFSRLAPNNLQQAINPWSLSFSFVNNQNSTSPEVERSIVEQHSYGRQIGRIMDAVEALARAQPQLDDDECIKDFRKLASEIEAIKEQTKAQSCARLQREIDDLERRDPDGYRRLQRRFAGG